MSELQIVATKGARLLEHFGPAFDCNSLTNHHIDLYIDARRADPVRPVQDATIGKELGKLFEALRQARRLGTYTGPDPATLRPTVLAADKPRTRWLDDHHYAALVEAIDGRGARGGGVSRTPKRDYVVTYCHTGVRYSELYRLEAHHFDRVGRRIFVDGSKTARAPRWVPLSPAALEVIARRSELYPSGPLFPYQWLKPNMLKSLAIACRRVGIEPVSANDLRRTFVSWCCRHGVSEIEVQKFVGHSPNSTLVRRVYAQLAPEAGRAALALFPGAP